MKKIITPLLVAVSLFGCKKYPYESSYVTIAYEVQVGYLDGQNNWVQPTALPENFEAEISFTKPDGTTQTEKISGSDLGVGEQLDFDKNGSVKDLKLTWTSNFTASRLRFNCVIRRAFSVGKITTGLLASAKNSSNGSLQTTIDAKPLKN
ncbi:hypothetical protein [Pedobacter sp. Leaf216]|uniref:hypothetical protein n=1 Tax=Pedobacter sp. Leaf216 TaxID=1735684 RepID=UPI000A9A09E7|nr:hypothetical protein [Pedobacter sp. Leaf216]